MSSPKNGTPNLKLAGSDPASSDTKSDPQPPASPPPIEIVSGVPQVKIEHMLTLNMPAAAVVAVLDALAGEVSAVQVKIAELRKSIILRAAMTCMTEEQRKEWSKKEIDLHNPPLTAGAPADAPVDPQPAQG